MLLITDVTAVTVDQRRRIIVDAAIAVDGDRIAEIGKSADLVGRYPDANRLDGRGMLAIPGLIDGHVHTAQTMLRSVADDVPWRPYLEQFIWPLQGRYTPEDALATMRLTLLELLKSGTTCFVDPLVHTRYGFDALAQAVLDMGLRGVLAKIVMDQAAEARQAGVIHPGMLESEKASLAEAERVLLEWNGAGNGRLQVWYGPRVPREPAVACSPAFYKKVADLAAESGSGITIHLAGEREDLDFFRRHFDRLPMEFARDHGLVGDNVLIAMGCWISDDEIAILTDTRTAVVHCPSANMKLASGVAPVPKMRAAGVTVALGCDSGANNNSLDLIREMKAASLLHSVSSMDTIALIAEDALEMATIDGARAIGRADDLGSLEIGKQADIVLVDLSGPHNAPCHDPIANLVYTAHGGDVDTVVVAGRVLMRGREVLAADEQSILAEVSQRSRDVLARAGIEVKPKWPVE